MLHIILVEDSAADAQIVRMALEQAGRPVEITVLDDGLTAIEYLTQSYARTARLPCDVVLLDLNLPRLSGVEVLERIRASEDLKGLPVIVMSGSSDPLDVERCYRAGSNSYVCKPTHLKDIFATAVQLVGYWSECVRLPSKRLPVSEPALPAAARTART